MDETRPGSVRAAQARAAVRLPPDAARWLARARSEWDAGQLDAAERSLGHALSAAPRDPKLVRMLGMVARRQGNYAKAVACFREVLAVWPDDPFLRSGLGLSLLSLDEVDAAAEHFRHACELVPDVASMWFNLGETLWRQARGEEAAAALEQALALEPANAEARLSLARVLAGVGRVDAAVAEFRTVLQRDPTSADGWYGLSLTVSGFDAADTARLQQLFARTDLPARTHYLLGFALAKALEDRGEYAAAFEVLDAANAAQRAHASPAWSAIDAHHTIAAIQGAFGCHTATAPDREAGEEVIFITGMPRSGSTLVEQILASHPQVQGANELRDLPQVLDAESGRRGVSFPAWVPDASADDWRRLGRRYLARTAHWHAHRPRFTDKNLMNWQFAGAALAMLPAARVIVVRRDPVETCFACYRHCFTDAAGFACDLDALAAYCGDFLRLTDFWLKAHPTRVFELRYEALVADPGRVIRGLLDFCGLPFDRACLDPHATARAVLTPSAVQVRQPLHGGTARSARYGDKLDRLRQRLREAGVLAP